MSPAFITILAFVGVLMVVGGSAAAIGFLLRYGQLATRERELRHRLQHHGASGQERLTRA
jgi:hypothetical protein